ncbi:uncharacterized protein LOC143280442 [Babylonia areolata]|uniref:uncharacterized protein LOC143280442 n=1 Tax=Babylonia areolata TaxID=304850 RepID=UPI003FD5BE9B
MAESCSGHTAADSGQTTHDGPDFSSLPDVVLVHLFKMLPVADRGALASTCSRLSAFLHCPSVWTDVTISLYRLPLCYIDNHRLNVTSLSDRDKVIIGKYGQYFKRVGIITDCAYLKQIDFDVLRDFAQRRIIESIFLYMDGRVPWTMKYTPNTSVPANPLPCVAELIHMLTPHTQMIVKVPSVLSDTNGNVFKFYSGSKTEVFRSLVKKLDLTQTETSEKVLENVLAKRDHRLSSAPTAKLIFQFPALQVLQLSTSNMSDALLMELADTSGRRCPLQSLVVRCMEWKPNLRTSDFPQLSSAAWKKLSSASPSLTVTCQILVDHLPPLSHVIKPETPLVKLKVRCTSRCLQVLELFDVCREHSSTLQDLNLSLKVQDVRVEEGLVNTVKACPRLQHLTCNMYIDFKIVQDLKTDSRQWRTFRFNVSRVTKHAKKKRKMSTRREISF